MDRQEIERVYSDPSAAQERAMRWQRLGIVSIRIEPINGRYVLTGMATAEQMRQL